MAFRGNIGCDDEKKQYDSVLNGPLCNVHQVVVLILSSDDTITTTPLSRGICLSCY